MSASKPTPGELGLAPCGNCTMTKAMHPTPYCKRYRDPGTPEALPSNNGSKLADSTDANGSAKPGPTPPDGIGELETRANARIFGKTYKQEIAFKEACARGETVEYHGANWVAMSRAQYNRLTTQPEEKPKVADSPGLGELEIRRVYNNADEVASRMGGLADDKYIAHKEAVIDGVLALLTTQPGAGTTLPTEHQADAATGELRPADDNAAPPDVDDLYDVTADLLGRAYDYGRHGYLGASMVPLREKLDALITADRTRLKQELLERVGELRSIGVPWTNPDTGQTLDIHDADAADRRLRAAIEAVFGEAA